MENLQLYNIGIELKIFFAKNFVCVNVIVLTSVIGVVGRCFSPILFSIILFREEMVEPFCSPTR